MGSVPSPRALVPEPSVRSRPGFPVPPHSLPFLPPPSSTVRRHLQLAHCCPPRDWRSRGGKGARRCQAPLLSFHLQSVGSVCVKLNVFALVLPPELAARCVSWQKCGSWPPSSRRGRGTGWGTGWGQAAAAVGRAAGSPGPTPCRRAEAGTRSRTCRCSRPRRVWGQRTLSSGMWTQCGLEAGDGRCSHEAG